MRADQMSKILIDALKKIEDLPDCRSDECSAIATRALDDFRNSLDHSLKIINHFSDPDFSVSPPELYYDK
jgi:hypothetical protein